MKPTHDFLRIFCLLAAALSVGPLRAADPAPSPAVVEFATFRLKPDATEAQLRAASPAVDRFLASCPGFVSRLLVAEGDGRFTDIVVWRSQREAEAALKSHEAHPETCAGYLCLMREDAGDMRHLRVVQATPAIH